MQAYLDVDDRQPRVATARTPLDLDARFAVVALGDRDRRQRLRAACNFVGSPRAQRGVNPMLVVPPPEGVQFRLQAADGERGQYESPPDPERSEQALDLAVEERLANFASDMMYAHALGRCGEPLVELGAVVGDDEVGLAVFLGGTTNQRRQMNCPWGAIGDAQRHQLPREAVHDRRDREAQPENTQRGQVQMPNFIGLRRREQVMGIDARGDRCRSFGARLGWFGLTQHPPHARAADDETGPDQVSGDCARAELGLGAEPPQFLRRPTQPSAV